MHLSGRVDSSDARHGMWNVAWVAHALTTQPTRLFQANIFHPHKDALAFSEANFVGGVIAIPAWLWSGDAMTAFNWTVLWAFVLSALSMFALVRHLTGSVPAAAFGAILFAFSPYMFSRLSHLQLLMTFGLPWTLLALHRYIDTPNWRRATRLGTVLALTALACGYYGIFAGLAALWGLAWFCFPTQLRSWRFWAGAGLAATVAALIVGPFFLPYRGVRAEGFGRTLDDARLFSVGWRSYLASGAVFHAWLLPLIGSWRAVLFPGFLPVTLAAVAIVGALRRGHDARFATSRRIIFCYATGGALAMWASFGPDAGLYRWLYDALPVFGWMRDPGRFGVMVTLAVSVLASVVFAELERRWQGWRRTAFMTAVIGAAVAGSSVGPVYLVDRSPVPEAYQRLAQMPAGPVVEFPYFTAALERNRHTEYMLASTRHWKPLLNGSSDHTPPDAFADGFQLAGFPDPASWRILEQRGARYVVIHWADYEPTASLGARISANVRGGRLREVVHQPGGVSLYEITRWPRHEP